MRTAFIIFSIFVSVVLLVRFAAPAVPLRFYRAERVSQKALIDNIRALGKRCAVTEYGHGIRYDSIKIRRIMVACKKRVECGIADDWQLAVNGSSEVILGAYSDGKSAARYSSYCGHVGKHPRVFLFCERLIRDCGCDITRNALLSGISVFEENAEFTRSERRILCGMLKLCLIGYLHMVAESALKRSEEYDNGVTDGKNGSVNLDYLGVDDYVCGLLQSCSSADSSAVKRLLEHNGVDACSADNCRRMGLAQTYVLVNSVLRSLSVIEQCASEIYMPNMLSGESVKRYAKVFYILFPILLVVYAVFTCAFASPKFVALFSVAAIITYVVMRIPMLLYLPTSCIDVFSPIAALFSRSTDCKNKDVAVSNRTLLTEAAYFGSQPQYMQTAICGVGIKLRCDNRGRVAIETNGITDHIFVGIKSDGYKIDLTECDGVIERHRAVYRACKGDLELCTETVVPIVGNVCIVRLTVVNRGSEDKTVVVTGAVVRKQPKSQSCYTQNIRGGAMAVCNNGFALSLGDGKYGGDLQAFCTDGMLKHCNVNPPALVGVTTLNVKRFARAVTYITIIYSLRRQAENMFEYTAKEKYFELALEGAEIYCKPNATENLPIAPSAPYSNRKNFKPVAVFEPPPMPKRECEYYLPFGGLANGEMVIDDNYTHKPIYNTLSGEQMRVLLSQFGIQGILVGRERFTASVDKYSHTPRAFVVIGEDGVMWSPTAKPLGGEQMSTVHCRGYTEYACAYNGTECVQKVFAVVGIPAVIFDITLHNKENIERRFDIMFSVLCDSSVSVALNGKGVTAQTKNSKLSIFAIGDSAEYVAYKEGYFVYGNIDRTSGFRDGGSTPAPTASVSITVKANSNERIVFCIADASYSDKLHSIVEIDNLFGGVKRFYERLGRISPATDDGVLNISYLQSLYSAYCAFAACKDFPLYSECFVLSAAKYVDPIAVKKRIYRILSEQNQSGLLGGDYRDCLQAAHCIVEFTEYMCDDRFWNEVLPYASFRLHGRRMVIKDTAVNHILRAVKYLIENRMPAAQSVVQNIRQYKCLLNVLRFAENKLGFGGSLCEQGKKRIAQASDGYARCAKILTANNLFKFQSVTEAFICAEHLFDLELNEQAYNIIKYNNPIERGLHYGGRAEDGEFDYFSDPIVAAVYFTTVTERLFGIKFRGKTLKICPHIARNMPRLQFDILGKSKDVRVTVDNTELCGNWRMRVNKINYPADSVDIRNLSDDIVFYRDGNE